MIVITSAFDVVLPKAARKLPNLLFIAFLLDGLVPTGTCAR
jgi:hypothetical protein